MAAYMWNLPSQRKITMFLVSYLYGNEGEVHPRTYPAERGFSCGMTKLVNPASVNFCLAKKRELLN